MKDYENMHRALLRTFEEEVAKLDKEDYSNSYGYATALAAVDMLMIRAYTELGGSFDVLRAHVELADAAKDEFATIEPALKIPARFKSPDARCCSDEKKPASKDVH